MKEIFNRETFSLPFGKNSKPMILIVISQNTYLKTTLIIHTYGEDAKYFTQEMNLNLKNQGYKNENI